ncbi:MAG: sensor histidine kinase [Synergistaceae bacterium]|jgi:two-component system sensor histidine kinase DegS|nr:sensor histidine kinase [Synergistaceae bacterium]
MGDESFRQKLQSVLDRTNEFLGYSIDNVGGIRDDVVHGLRDLYDELNQVRKEVSEVMSAYDSVTQAYKEARRSLVSAEMTDDYDLQARIYAEAERYMHLRATFEERERYLRKRRDDLDREKIRMERIMAHSTSTMGKLRLAVEILRNRLDSTMAASSAGNAANIAKALQFVERENKRLAREIHDGPIQQFAASILSLEYLERIAGKGDMAAVKEEIQRVKEQQREALADFRGFLIQLQPLGLEKGLGSAIRRLADSYRERHGVDFRALLSQDEDQFPAVLRSNLFRIIQEAASNALRHGGAKTITVKYEYTNKELCLSIQDDGSGFDIEAERVAAAERGSFGLSNISERVQFARGNLNIESGKGKGTEITITVPIGGDGSE